MSDYLSPQNLWEGVKELKDIATGAASAADQAWGDMMEQGYKRCMLQQLNAGPRISPAQAACNCRHIRDNANAALGQLADLREGEIDAIRDAAVATAAALATAPFGGVGGWGGLAIGVGAGAGFGALGEWLSNPYASGGDILRSGAWGGAGGAFGYGLGKTLQWGAGAIGRSLGSRMFNTGPRGAQLASPSLMNKLVGRGYLINQDADTLLYLNSRGANAATLGTRDLLLRPDARQIEVLEEWLHNVQVQNGIADRLGRGSPAVEDHVHDFMIRHQRLLGISDDDLQIIRRMLP